MILALFLACGSPTPVPVPPTPPPPPKSAAASDAIYFVLVDRFANGTPDAPGSVDLADPQAFHGGDIQGVIDQLDHIQGMGFGAIWLSPITSMRTEKIDEWGAFHGYWVSDIGIVEPRFGTMEQVKTLSWELRDRDMELYLDMVYNHVGYDTRLVDLHPEWFHHNGDIVDWTDETQVRTHDVHGLPDLAQDDAKVYAYLLRRSIHWITEIEPTGFRIDAVRHLDAGFLAGFGNDLKAIAGDDFQILGEVFEGDPVQLARAVEVDKLSSVFDFPLHYAMRDVFCDRAHLGRIASILSQDAIYGEAPPLVTFLDNHDRPRIGDCELAPQALAFLLTARGRPAITYGTEIRLEGAEEPHNRGDMRFGESHPMEGDIRTWLMLRATSPAARTGTTTLHALTEDFLLYSRNADTEALLIAVNLGDAPVSVDVNEIFADARVEASWAIDERTVKQAAPPTEVDAMVVWRLSGVWTSAPPPSAALEIVASGLPRSADTVAVLVGTGPLGGWDPESGLVGEWTGTSEASFRLTRPRGAVLAYKIVVRGDESTWENRSDRYLLTGESKKLTLTWER